MTTKTLITCACLGVVAGVFSATYYQPSNTHVQVVFTKHQYIAHALGGINGKTYTNSKEALNFNYQAGKRLFEVDFQVTKDNQVVAFNDHVATGNALLKKE